MILTGPKPEPQLPEGVVLDPDADQPMADRGIWLVVLPDGTHTAWNERAVICPVCNNDPDARPDCSHCSGRGRVDHIPFPDRPWDEVSSGLYLGGHDSQQGPGFLPPGGQFDYIVSLHQDPDPRFHDQSAVEVQRRIADAELDPEHHAHIDRLVEDAYAAWVDGASVLVRCHAGLNRSALIVAQMLMLDGMSAEAAIAHLRKVRSPYVLCNPSFVQYIHQKENR